MSTRRAISWRSAAAVAALAAMVVAGQPSAAMARPEAASGKVSYRSQLLAKATPDECFVGIGLPYPAGPPCAEGQAKTNQGYVWGMTRHNKKIWFGTGANINCLTSGRNLHPEDPNLNADWVCEYGQSQIAKRNPSLPASLGDHRPPRIYVYDTRSNQLVEKTNDVKNASQDDATRLTTTAGIRAAGTHNGVVFLAGPALSESINLYAFDADNGAFLGSVNLPQYGNIRHFVVADGALYAGVGVGANGGNRGHVLRWTGSKSNPFSFVQVANLPAQAADLTVHEGRIFVTTWIGSGDEGTAGASSGTGTNAADPPVPGMASVWMSPKLNDGQRGLNPADADLWTRVWSVSQYEPDAVVARTYALGGLASYKGHLYWGTMHVPLKATYMHLLTYPPANETEAGDQVRYTQRAIGIFRGKNFGNSHQKVDLLYGSPELPAYDPAGNNGEGLWYAASTNYTPVYGTSGFGNQFLNYTWKMVVADDRLYVGTMDWSYISKDLGSGTRPQLAAPAEKLLDDPAATARLLGESASAARALGGATTTADDDPEPPAVTYGADLWAFSSSSKPATAVSQTGVGNYLNYGVRNMVTDGSTVYLGMANPMNLRTDPNDDVPEGGWELIKLTASGC